MSQSEARRRRRQAAVKSDHTPDEMKLKIFENKICADVGRKLVEHYPDWQWDVECLAFGQVVNVKNTFISNTHGFTLHFQQLINDPDLKEVVRHAGELLERAGLPRSGPLDPEQLQCLKRDPKGDLVSLDTHGA